MTSGRVEGPMPTACEQPPSSSACLLRLLSFHFNTKDAVSISEKSLIGFKITTPLASDNAFHTQFEDS